MKNLFKLNMVLSLILTLNFCSDSNGNYTFNLNDTGVTLHRDNNGGFDQANEYNWLPRQDAAIGRDVTNNDDSDGHAGFSFTVLDSAGNKLSGNTITNNPNVNDLCVRDNVTGLVWEVKKDDGSNDTYKVFRDKNSGYTWYNTDDNFNGDNWGVKDGNDKCVGSDGTKGSNNNKICNSASYIDAVNDMKLCGYTNWRLPTTIELMSIVANNKFEPAIDTDYFPNTRAAWTLTSQTSPEDKMAAWVVGFYDGMAYGADVDTDNENGKNGKAWKSDWNYAVRLVSGIPMPNKIVSASGCNSHMIASAPNNRYTVNSNGTVIDKRTNLMWKQCAEGLSGSDCATGTAEVKDSWYAILGGTNNPYPDFLSLSGWRVPNIKELGSLVEEACVKGINSTVFPNTPADNVFASSTPVPGGIDMNMFYAIHFGSGTNFRTSQKSNGISGNGSYVRLVRDND